MMKYLCLLMFSLLVLSTLIHEAQGIRFRKDLVEKIDDEGGEVVKLLCKGKHCSGRVRKLSMIHSSSSTTISKSGYKSRAQPKPEGYSTNKNVGIGGENLPVNPSQETKKPHGTLEPNPDIVGIAGMDYSLASRKPPIHN